MVETCPRHWEAWDRVCAGAELATARTCGRGNMSQRESSRHECVCASSAAVSTCSGARTKVHSREKRQGGNSVKWLPPQLSVSSDHLGNSGGDISYCPLLGDKHALLQGSLNTNLWKEIGRRGELTSSEPDSLGLTCGLPHLRRGTLGEEWQFWQRPAGAEAPSLPKAGEGNRLQRGGLGAFQSSQPRHFWGLRKGAQGVGGLLWSSHAEGNTPSDPPSTDTPDTRQSWAPAEGGHLPVRH